MMAIAPLPIREMVELNYKVAYYIAQNALAEGSSPHTIRQNTFRMEAFERVLKHAPKKSATLEAVERVAKWMGVEDALAGRPENPRFDDFLLADFHDCEIPSRVYDELSHSLAYDDEDSGSRYSFC
jgi:hypothetical protein